MNFQQLMAGGSKTPQKGGVLKFLFQMFNITADACDTVSGLISFVYTARRFLIFLVIYAISKTISSFTNSSKKINTKIVAVKPDTHVLHEFSGVIVTPRTVKRTRSYLDPKTRKRRTQEYTTTVYDVTNFVSPNGQTMNNLSNLSFRPTSNRYPVRLKNGSVDGGTVQVPQRMWNPCVVNTEHKGKQYLLTRPHDRACSTLIGRMWGVYKDSKGRISTHNAVPWVKTISSLVALVSFVELARESIAMGLLLGNGFYMKYELPKIFESELGDAGRKYAKWWTWAFKSDKREECLQVLGDVLDAVGLETAASISDFAEGATGWVKFSTDSIALAYLKALTTMKDVKSPVDTFQISKLGFQILLKRILFTLLLFAVVYVVLQQYVFLGTLRIEEGLTRPLRDRVLVLVGAIVLTVMFRQYVNLAHTSYLRRNFRNRIAKDPSLDAELVQDFLRRFPVVDHARLAL